MSAYQQQPVPAGNGSIKKSQPFILKEDEKMPLFLIKLWNIVEDPAYYDVIRWDDSGYSFHILDPYSFCRNVLPQYFKHNNLNSLIRQLNMYGFRKMTPIERTSLARAESDQDHLEFSHPYFVRDHPELLVNIKRKAPNARPHPTENTGTVQIPSKDLSTVLDELRQLRERQKAMEAKIQDLVKENELIWQEMHHMRGTHIKQQQIVNKLVQFLVALVQPQKRLGKRHLLAIDEIQSKKLRTDGAGNSRPGPSKIVQTIQNNNINEVLDQLLNQFTDSNSGNLNFNNGPIIADVTDELDQLAAASQEQQPDELLLNMEIPTNKFSSNLPKYSNSMDNQVPLYVFQNPRNQSRTQQQIPQSQVQMGQVPVYTQAQQIGYQPHLVAQSPGQQLIVPSPQAQPSPKTRISTPQLPYEAISPLPPQNHSLPSTIAAPIQQMPPVSSMTGAYNPASGAPVVASASSPEPGLEFSPTDFSYYLNNIDQGIDNCRELIGEHWDNLDFDGLLDYESCSPEENLQHAMATPPGSIDPSAQSPGGRFQQQNIQQ